MKNFKAVRFSPVLGSSKRIYENVSERASDVARRTFTRKDIRLIKKTLLPLSDTLSAIKEARKAVGGRWMDCSFQ